MLFPWWWSALPLPPPHEGWRWWHDLLITLRNYHSSLNWLWQWQRLTVEELHDIPTWFLTAGTCTEGQMCVWFTCGEKSGTDRRWWALHLNSHGSLRHENTTYTVFSCWSTLKFRFCSIQTRSLVKLVLSRWNFPCRFYASSLVCWKPSHSPLQQLQEGN